MIQPNEEDKPPLPMMDGQQASQPAPPSPMNTLNASAPDMSGGPPAPAAPGGAPMGGGMPPQMLPPPPAQTVHDVKISRVKKYGCVKIENVPPEEFGVTKRQRSVMLQDCDYCYHETVTTESALIAEGYDEDQIKELPNYPSDSSTESLARDTVDESLLDGDKLNKANRPIRRTEHYINLDYEGNGKARRYRITTGGEPGKILKHNGKDAITPDMVRFAAMTPFIMTHRFFGRSVADLVMDIQRIKTALTRGLLNNVYFANNQRLLVAEGAATKDTLDDILANRPGGVIRVKDVSGVTPVQNQEIGSFAFPMVQYYDGVREWRTGVTKQGQGLDPNALQNIGENAILDAANAARAKTKLLARIFAETGVKAMCWLVHATARENATQADTIKLRGEWVDVNPSEFRSRDDLTVNVGLGNGSKAEELAITEKILNFQIQAYQNPKTQMVEPKNLYATMKRYVRLSGWKNIEPYFSDPTKMGPPPDEPSIDEKKLMLEAKGKELELNFQMAKSQQDGQAQQMKAQQDSQLQQAKAAQDGQLQREKMQMEHQLKQEQMAGELQLKREQLIAELQLKRELGMYEIANRPAPMNGGGTSSVHVGGEPG